MGVLGHDVGGKSYESCFISSREGNVSRFHVKNALDLEAYDVKFSLI